MLTAIAVHRRGRLTGKVRLIVCAVACCVAFPGAAQEGGAGAPDPDGTPEREWEVQYDPARFVAGDRVLARIVVSGATRLTAPDEVAGGDWLSVHDVEVLPRTDGGWEVRVWFTSYRPGVAELPPIDLGPLQLTGIGFLTAAELPRYGEAPPALRPPAAPMAVPGTAALLVVGGLALLAMPYLLVSGALRLAGARRGVRARRARARPRMLLERAVRQLQAGGSAGADGPTGVGSSTAAGAAVSYYGRLAQLARRYLAERLALPAHALTVRELRAALPERGLPHGLGADLTAILDTADRVKFAGHDADAAQMQAAARQLVTLARAIDAVLEERAARRRGENGVEL